MLNLSSLCSRARGRRQRRWFQPALWARWWANSWLDSWTKRTTSVLLCLSEFFQSLSWTSEDTSTSWHLAFVLSVSFLVPQLTSWRTISLTPPATSCWPRCCRCSLTASLMTSSGGRRRSSTETVKVDLGPSDGSVTASVSDSVSGSSLLQLQQNINNERWFWSL